MCRFKHRDLLAEIRAGRNTDATDLRSQTQGQGTFTMELARYKRVPTSIQEEIVAEKKGQLVGSR